MLKFNFKHLLSILCAVFIFAGCTEFLEGLETPPNDQTEQTPGEDNGGGENEGGDDSGDNGGEDGSFAEGELDWVFDMEVLPEIRITVTEAQWNELLSAYDRDSDTNHYIHCDAEFKSKGETHNFVDAGLRLRGNTSRRRPEGNGGEMHNRNNADWHHCHFMLNLRK